MRLVRLSQRSWIHLHLFFVKTSWQHVSTSDFTAFVCAMLGMDRLNHIGWKMHCGWGHSRVKTSPQIGIKLNKARCDSWEKNKHDQFSHVGLADTCAMLLIGFPPLFGHCFETYWQMIKTGISKSVYLQLIVKNQNQLSGRKTCLIVERFGGTREDVGNAVLPIGIGFCKGSGIWGRKGVRIPL